PAVPMPATKSSCHRPHAIPSRLNSPTSRSAAIVETVSAVLGDCHPSIAKMSCDPDNSCPSAKASPRHSGRPAPTPVCFELGSCIRTKSPSSEGSSHNSASPFLPFSFGIPVLPDPTHPQTLSLIAQDALLEPNPPATAAATTVRYNWHRFRSSSLFICATPRSTLDPLMPLVFATPSEKEGNGGIGE